MCSPRLGVDSWEVRMKWEELPSIVRVAIWIICLGIVIPPILCVCAFVVAIICGILMVIVGK